MKAEIDASGTLIVAAETPLECYAIRQWSNAQIVEVKDGVGLMKTNNFIVTWRNPNEQ